MVADLVLLEDGSRWQEALPFVARIISKEWRGKFEVEDIETACAKGEFQCWAWIVGGRVLGILITRIMLYPRVKMLELLGLAGSSREDWLPSLAIVEQWGRDRGCKLMEAVGRSGWEVIMGPHGFRKIAVVIAKEI